MKKGKGSRSLGSKESSGRPSSSVLVSKECARLADSSGSAGIQQDGKKQMPERDDSLDAKESAGMERESISNRPLNDEPLKDEPNQSECTGISTIPAIDKLRRFCFIGSTDEPVYARPALDLVVENNFATLKELCSQVSENELVECLVSVLGIGPNTEHLPRPDEPLLILAVFFATCEDEKKRNSVRNRFTDLVTSESDLLLFVQLVKRVQKVLERKTPFNRTVRKAVLNWYGHEGD
ncbi:GM12294 [Drosophila sechellia]|uniref:GM12294 n=1 Tax=Drosophila sechellia TaxID=7238 RepID=B4I168_DROSE|nr:GM12294 [Drosophila sechellia]